MGSTWIDGFLEDGMELSFVLEQHLSFNCYPPVNTVFVPVCKQAIECARANNWHEEITMPNGKILTAWSIIEQLHLHTFLQGDEE